MSDYKHLTLLLLGAACVGQDLPSVSDDLTEDTGIEVVTWTAPEGRAEGAADDSPGVRRLLLAESTDGRAFTRRDEIVLDQSNGPAALRTDEAVFVYSTAHGVNGQNDGTVVSVRRDGEEGWSHYVPAFLDLPEGPNAGVVEAYGVALPEGGVRLYFAAAFDERWTIHAAVSPDGLVFRYEGEIVASNGAIGHDGGYVDPMVVWWGGQWHLFLTDSGTIAMVHGVSDDGVNFELDETLSLADDENIEVLSSWLALQGGLRAFASRSDGAIRSYWTSDGVNLEREEGASLEPESGALEGSWVRDAAVVEQDGGYWMIYVSEIPA